MRKALLGVAVVLVATIGVTGAAGAASGHTSATPARLSTQAAAADYLRSLGIDPAGVVVQRGAKNYAGPKCPGPDWNCTTARQVLQISARVGAASANSFSCTPAGGGTLPPNKCVIVQSSAGNNTASCTIAGSTSGVTQECNVTQTSVSGTNRLTLKEELTLTGATTTGTQVATVDQNNGSGANIVSLTQRSAESMSSGSASIGTWSQSASQSFTIDQESNTGANTVDVSQSVAQTQTALNATSGSQSQSSTQEASIDQSSSGLSTLKIKQSETQTQRAQTTGVTQTQFGPQRCCSSQTGNPNNTATVKQDSVQTQSPSNDQTQQQTVVYSSSGNISGVQTAGQDGVKTTNTFSGSTVAETQSCVDGSCTTEPAPTPENWQAFNWSSPEGPPAVPDESPISFEAGAPVVVSVTDVLCTGDRFTLSESETTLGTTSVPGSSTCDHPGFTGDPAVAFTDPAYSKGTFALGAGSHSIDIVVSTTPYTAGTAYLSVDPMTTAHCAAGRWATFTYPTFTSEADCLAFVT